MEGLTFLHNDAKILQASLAPEMIVITKNGQWKIAGLFFSSTPVVIDGQVINISHTPLGAMSSRPQQT